MTDKLEPLSDPMKELLTSCGINPQEFQQGVALRLLAKRARKTPGAKSNQEYYDRSGRVETIASVAKRIQSAKPHVYIPLGYVLFKRTSICACGSITECMDCPSLYLLETDKPGSPTRRYTPVPSVQFPSLPHWVKEVGTKTLYCLDCYSTQVLPETSPANLGPTTETQSTDVGEPVPCQV